MNSYDENVYLTNIVKGDLVGAIDYIKQFPEKNDLVKRYESIFNKKQYVDYDIPSILNDILKIYQEYYRDVFFLDINHDKSIEKLRNNLANMFDDMNADLEYLEQNCILKAFQKYGFYFMGGKTGGYYGPYIWKSSENINYEVELPEGRQTYSVRFLDDFVMLSWMDYLSFGKVSTGGWTNGDGTLNCVKKSYDLNSENFLVSLLKHEAQHARDLSNNRCMSSEDLEFRAKLVELIYSKERNLLKQFSQEIGGESGHSLAAKRILDEYIFRTNLDFESVVALPIEKIQSIAKIIFLENSMNKPL